MTITNSSNLSLDNSINTLSDYDAVVQKIVKQSKDTNLLVQNFDLLSISESEFDWVANTNAFQRLRHLAELPDKWDGYNAPAFSRRQVNRAFGIFASIQSYQTTYSTDWQQLEPFIAPGADGSILFEWAGKRFPDKNLEIYVTQQPNSSIEYLQTDIVKGIEIEGECQTTEITELLTWLLNPIL